MCIFILVKGLVIGVECFNKIFSIIKCLGLYDKCFFGSIFFLSFLSFQFMFIVFLVMKTFVCFYCWLLEGKLEREQCVTTPWSHMRKKGSSSKCVTHEEGEKQS